MGVIKRALGSGEYSQMANVKIEMKLRDVAQQLWQSLMATDEYSECLQQQGCYKVSLSEEGCLKKLVFLIKFNSDFFLILVNLQTTIVRDGKQQPGNKTDFAN